MMNGWCVPRRSLEAPDSSNSDVVVTLEALVVTIKDTGFPALTCALLSQHGQKLTDDSQTTANKELQGTSAQVVKGYFTLFPADLTTQKPLKSQVSSPAEPAWRGRNK